MLRRTLIAFTVGVAAMAASAYASEDRIEPTPAALKSVDVVEHPNAQIPGELEFIDELGKRVKLGDYLNQGKPVVLTLNYLACPMLCTLMLNGMVDCLQEVPLSPGKDYQIVTVSFNPSETQFLAKQKQQNYLQYWGGGISADGWHFLTGKQERIDALCNAVGFSYHYIEETGQYAHPAVLILLTPDGRVSRYIYGVKYDEQTVKLSLVEAAKGKIGTPLDRIMLYCYHYDSSSGVYAPVAMNIMRFAGTVTLIALVIVLAMFWAAEKRRHGAGSPPPPISAQPGVSSL